MKNTTQTEFVEDLLQRNTIDINALSKAKFKHPIRHWFRVKYLIAKDKIEEVAWKIINIFR